MTSGNNEIAKVNSALIELDQIFGSREKALAVTVSGFVRICLLDTVSDDILNKLDTPGEICSLWLSQRRAAQNSPASQEAVAI